MSGGTVLITRPREAARALADELTRAGWRPLLWPLLEIARVAPSPDPAGFQAVLLTSAHAARLSRPGAAPAFCVGDATARAARAAGYAEAVSASGDAAALARLVAERLHPQDGPLLHPRAREVAADLAAELGKRGFEVVDPVIYAARPAGPPEARTLAALRAGEVALALFYSPRTAKFFAREAESLGLALAATQALAISRAAAAPLARCGFRAIRIAEAPSGAAMRRAIDAFAA